MSEKLVAQFLDQSFTKAEIQKKVLQIDDTDRSEAMWQLTKIAREEGYDLDQAELEAGIKALHDRGAKAMEAEQMSEADLDRVAGGGSAVLNFGAGVAEGFGAPICIIGGIGAVKSMADASGESFKQGWEDTKQDASDVAGFCKDAYHKIGSWF